MAVWRAEDTRLIIAAAIAVHRELGPGFLESVYERAMAVELARLGLPFRRQVRVPVLYRGVRVGLHVVDLLIDDRIVVELKAVRDLEDVHYVVLRSYLRAVDREIGLLLNFAKPSLQIKRVSTHYLHAY